MNDGRSLRQAGLTVLAGNIALPLLALVTAPIIARGLGPEGRGVLAAVVNAGTIGLIVGLVGTPFAIVNFVGGGRIRGLLRSTVLLILPTSVCAVPLILVYGKTQNEKYLPLFILAACTLPLSLALDLRRAWLTGLSAFSTVTWERVVVALLRAICIAALFATSTLTAATAVYATVVAAFLGGALLLRRGPRPSKITTERATVRSVGRYSLLSWVGLLTVYGNGRLDQFVLAPAVSLSALGLYVVAVTYVELTSTVTQAVETVVRTKGVSEFRAEFVARTAAATTAINAVLLLAAAAAAPLVVPLIFGTSFVEALPIIYFLAVAQIFSGPGRVLEAALAATGAPQEQAKAQALGLLLTCIGLLALVPTYGATGAAMTSVVAYAATYFYVLWSLSSRTGIPPTSYLPGVATWRLLWRESRRVARRRHVPRRT